LEFKTLNTECSYDYVFVYDGDSFNSPLLGSYSGKNQPQSILASSGFVSIFASIYHDNNLKIIIMWFTKYQFKYFIHIIIFTIFKILKSI